MPGQNFHSVYMAAEILLVECKACGRRSQLDKATTPQIHQGNMTELGRVKFTCGNRACGSHDVWLYIPHSGEEATMWLAGDPLPAGRQVAYRAPA
jgi:hypothetical protein